METWHDFEPSRISVQGIQRNLCSLLYRKKPSYHFSVSGHHFFFNCELLKAVYFHVMEKFPCGTFDKGYFGELTSGSHPYPWSPTLYPLLGLEAENYWTVIYHTWVRETEGFLNLCIHMQPFPDGAQKHGHRPPPVFPVLAQPHLVALALTFDFKSLRALLFSPQCAGIKELCVLTRVWRSACACRWFRRWMLAVQQTGTWSTCSLAKLLCTTHGSKEQKYTRATWTERWQKDYCVPLFQASCLAQLFLCSPISSGWLNWMEKSMKHKAGKHLNRNDKT